MARRSIWLLVVWLFAFFLMPLQVLVEELVRTWDDTFLILQYFPPYVSLPLSLLACWGITIASRHHLAVRVGLLVGTVVGLFLQMLIIAAISIATSGMSGTQ